LRIANGMDDKANMVDQEVLGRQLRKAARTNDFASLKAALDAGADPNFVGTDDGDTLRLPVKTLALHHAASGGFRECTEALLVAGAYLLSEDEYFRTALELALRKCEDEVYVQWLVDEYGATSTGIASAVALAAEKGWAGALERLLAHGCEASLPGVTGYSALLGAAYKGSVDCVQVLLNAGAKIDELDQHGKTALMVAAKHGHVGVMRLLVDAGCDTRHSCHDNSALHFAAGCAGNTDGIALLLSLGAYAWQRNKNGRTPFRVALDLGHVANVETLTALGAAEKLDQDELNAALVGVTKDGLAPMVAKLFSMGADPDHVDSNGRTLLQHARGKLGVREQILAARSVKLIGDAVSTAPEAVARSRTPGVAL
jgi:ankyrin repeat protein